LAKDRKPDDSRTSRGGSGKGSGATGATGARSGTKTATKPPTRPAARPTGAKGRTRPPTAVVTQQRKPWGLIAAAVAVVVFGAAVITYAFIQVNKSHQDDVTSLSQIKGVQSFTYAAGQQHVQAAQDYAESPPVGGPHDPYWADCTGTVYTVDIRHENAVHSLEHGAVWIAYNPDKLSSSDIAKLAALVDGVSGRMLSPYAGLDSAVSVQSWNHQLKVNSVSDKRIKQFADLMTFNSEVDNHYPEIGASCENPAFKANPVVVGQDSTAVGSSDVATTPTATSAP
jgi:Protein of unknown function (DUF3105)